MSRPATRSANSGSSSTSCIIGSYDERAVAVAAVRRSQGRVESLVRGLEAPLSSPEGWLPASDSFTGSGPPRKHDVSERPRPQLPRPSAPAQGNISRPGPAGAGAAAPGAAGPSGRRGSAARFSRHSGVTPGHQDSFARRELRRRRQLLKPSGPGDPARQSTVQFSRRAPAVWWFSGHPRLADLDGE